MVLNFTDPFLTTRVLGFENLFDRLQRFLNLPKDHQATHPTTLDEIKIVYLLMLLWQVSREKI
jgi:hypothetical protein